MKIRATASAIPRHRFPIEPWRLVETEPNVDDLGLTETLFAIGNGYLGMRANPAEGRDAHTHGTYVNGFHETWQIQHAEDAFAFAKTGQTIVNVPDAKLLKLYVDDEPLLLDSADLDHYERAVDFRSGVSHRELLWRTPGGKRVHIRSERVVSLAHRHLALMHMEVTLLDESAPIVISSQLLNRQDGEDEYHVRAAALGEGTDPRRARKFDRRVLEPKLGRHDDHDYCDHEHTGREDDGYHGEHDDPDGGQVTLGYRCASSGMTIACAYRHVVDTGLRLRRHHGGQPRSREVGVHVRRSRRPDDQDHQVRDVPHVAGHPRGRARRPLHPHDRPSDGHGSPPDLRRAAIVARPLLDEQRRRDRRRPGSPAGDPVEPLSTRPGVGPDTRAGHRREGGHRRRLRRPLLLGHRGVRPAVPGLHQPGGGQKAPPVPLPHARTRPGHGPPS